MASYPVTGDLVISATGVLPGVGLGVVAAVIDRDGHVGVMGCPLVCGTYLARVLIN